MKERGSYLKDDKGFYNWLRSQLRLIWRDHPTRRDFIKHSRYTKKINGRPIYHLKCEICKKEMCQSAGGKRDYEINHRVNCGDVSSDGYVHRLLNVGFGDLEILCKHCHSIATYSERMGISFEEAKLEKKVIAFSKLKAAEQKQILGENSKAKNAKDRRNEYREQIQGNV